MFGNRYGPFHGWGFPHHRLGQRPEHVPPREHLAHVRLHAAVVLRPRRLHSLEQKARDEIELHGEPRAAVHHEPREESGSGEEVVRFLHVPVDEHVLPGHEHVVHDEHRVVLIETARERLIERARHHCRCHLVGRAAKEFDALRVGREHEDQSELLVLQRNESVVSNEREVREHRTRRDHFRARDDEPAVRLLLHVHADVRDLIWRLVPVHGRMNDRVVHERHALLAEGVPAFRVVLIWLVELRIAAQRAQERCLVVGSPAHPAVSDPLPFGNRIAPGNRFLQVLRRLEECVRHAVAVGVRGQQQLL